MDKDSSPRRQICHDEQLIPLHPAMLEFCKRGKQHHFPQVDDSLHVNTLSGAAPKAAANHQAFLRHQLNYSQIKPEFVPALLF
jgi:hypothetical protein